MGRGDDCDRRARRRRLRPYATSRPGPVRAAGAPRVPPPGRATAVSSDRGRAVRRAGRSCRSACPPVGALERVQLLLADWREGRRRLAETEAWLTALRAA